MIEADDSGRLDPNCKRQHRRSLVQGSQPQSDDVAVL